MTTKDEAYRWRRRAIGPLAGTIREAMERELARAVPGYAPVPEYRDDDEGDGATDEAIVEDDDRC